MDHIDIQSEHFFDYVDFDLKYQYYIASDPEDIDPSKVREDIKKRLDRKNQEDSWT